MRLSVLLRRSDRDTFVHPSTRLPGTHEIEADITRRLAIGEPFAACYADLDHFKEFNDRYSYNDGDRVIRILAKILHDVVKGICGEQGFVGHIGGDDFIFNVPATAVADTCGEVIAVFDALVPYQYSEQDRRAGYFFGKDRRGQLHRVPLMTVSIGVVTNERRTFVHAALMTELATEMKSYAKTLDGSLYTVDRRQDGVAEPPIVDSTPRQRRRQGMNVTCPECRSMFRVDPAKVPPAGIRARCSVCGGVISIVAESANGAPAHAHAHAAPPPPRASARAAATSASTGAGASNGSGGSPSGGASAATTSRPRSRAATGGSCRACPTSGPGARSARLWSSGRPAVLRRRRSDRAPRRAQVRPVPGPAAPRPAAPVASAPPQIGGSADRAVVPLWRRRLPRSRGSTAAPAPVPRSPWRRLNRGPCGGTCGARRASASCSGGACSSARGRARVQRLVRPCRRHRAQRRPRNP